MDDSDGCQLLEHPNQTIRRLKAIGVWPEADRMLRKVKQRFRRWAVKSDAAMTAIATARNDHDGMEGGSGALAASARHSALTSIAHYLPSTRGAQASTRVGHRHYRRKRGAGSTGSARQTITSTRSSGCIITWTTARSYRSTRPAGGRGPCWPARSKRSDFTRRCTCR